MFLIRLTSDEFGVLVRFIRDITSNHNKLPLKERPLALAVLQAYLDGLTCARLYTWFTLRSQSRKAYQLKLPLPVVLALYNELQHQPVTQAEQMLLFKLDGEIVGYRDPAAQPQHISHLISTH